jgi:hypothetical protein
LLSFNAQFINVTATMTQRKKSTAAFLNFSAFIGCFPSFNYTNFKQASAQRLELPNLE